jgi:hypothetical protein
MRLKHRIGDFISAIIIVAGLMLDLLHHPYGKTIFYGGFLMLALSEIYYGIYLVIQRKERIKWHSIAIPTFLMAGVAFFYFTNAKSSLAMIILALATAMIQKNKLLIAAK